MGPGREVLNREIDTIALDIFMERMSSSQVPDPLRTTVLQLSQHFKANLQAKKENKKPVPPPSGPLAARIERLYASQERREFYIVKDGEAFRILLDMFASSSQIPDPLKGDLETLRDAVYEADRRFTNDLYDKRDYLNKLFQRRNPNG